MTKTFLFATMMAAVAFTSCSDDMDSVNNEQLTVNSEQSQTFTFRMTGADLSVTQTRALLSANGSALTDLYVLDYDKTTGTLLQVLHQQSTDPKFAEPELTLTYGQHTIRFVATRSTGSKLTLADGTEFVTTPGTVQAISTSIPTLWTALKISDTFSASVDVTAGAGASGSTTVTLARTVARLQLYITDVVPQDADHVNISISTAYTAMPLATLSPATQTERIANFDITSRRGTIDLQLNVYTLAPSADWTSTVTIECQRADNTNISTFTLSDVPFSNNRTTVIKGDYFQRTNALTFSLNDTWKDEEIVTF